MELDNDWFETQALKHFSPDDFKFMREQYNKK